MEEPRSSKAQQVIDLMLQIREGAFLNELYDAMQAAIEGQARIGKVASCVATFTFQPAGADRDGEMFIGAESVTKLPPVQAKKQIFFPAEGLPTRRDQRQPDLFAPRVVESSGKASNE